ncbi:Hypothetical predicted protein [Prunus dulcis]|uniref:Uncharacterized protein n=1 Tax=Prunus dulcis TaxID=3755 RepID=A0A5E4G1Y3_PRUDU|nr:Hypothetical predicted protein [Prunus dulcis]
MKLTEDEYVFKLCEVMFDSESQACPKLIDRFEEREENVNVNQNECQWIISLHGINYFAADGFFNTFIELLQQTENVTKGQIEINDRSPKWLLKQEVPKIVRSINRQLHEKSIKTKISWLITRVHSVQELKRRLSDKSFTSNLKIEALIFARLVLASHSPSVFSILISSPVVSAVGERYYKVTAEALRVCRELFHVVRLNIEGIGFDFKPYVHPIYNAIISRLTNKDQDHPIYEVNECAISCMDLVV